ncbi:MAG: hypothetical protein OEM38_01195 [Gammaproteobacteria bacterium]|nr:hypothetical protein [Gammaproteobacteria bacterium]
MHRLIVTLFLCFSVMPVFAYGGKSLPSPKALPDTKTLPTSKALPSTKSLPAFKSLPAVKKLPRSKSLPKPKILVLKPVFEPEPMYEGGSDDSGPIFDPSLEPKHGPKFNPRPDHKPKSKPKPDPRFDQPSEISKMEKTKVQWDEGVLNLTLDTISHGDIRIFTTDKFNPLFIRKITLISQLENYLMPEIYQQLFMFFRDRKWIDKAELTTMGFEVNVDIVNLVIDVSVPANYRKIKTQQLGGNMVQSKTIDIHPSRRSASITPYWSRTWHDLISVTNYVDLDAAVNFDGWVLESDSSYDLIDSKHRRKTTRLIRDYPEQVTRVSAGDVEYKTIGLMGRMPLGGMSISREFSLSPNLLTTPISHQRIFLENDATVRIFVNNIPRQSFSLRAGYYDLQDFPLMDGLNFVKIEITDIFGQITTHEYIGFDNKKVLVPGITDYSLTTGFERLTDEILSTQYDLAEPAFSGYVRHGVHKNVTLGLLTEGGHDFLSAGGYAVATHVLGTLEASGLVSANVDGTERKGYGASANYYFSTRRFTFSNTAYVKSFNFAYLGRNEYSEAQKYFYSATMGMPVPFFQTWRHSYSGRYEKRWNGSEDARATAKLSGRFSKNVTFSADVFYTIDGNRNNIDKGVTLSLRWYPQKRISVATSYDSQTDGVQLDVARGPEGEQGVGMNASLANNDTTRRLNGGLTWKSQYFDTRYSLNVNQDKSTDEQLIQDQRRFENYSLTSSFAFVDGVFAMGPPIRNGSFVIFKSGEGLGDGRIAIARSGDEDDRGAMPFLNGTGSVALYTGLNQYGSSTAHMLPYLEDGFIGLDKRQYRIFSGYRSGALINVTKDIKMYGSGVLANREWQPIGLIKGTFIHEDTKEKTRFFTDEEGYFEVENLHLGKYLIVLDGTGGSGEVVVKPSDVNGVAIGKMIGDNFIDFGMLSLGGVN